MGLVTISKKNAIISGSKKTIGLLFWWGQPKIGSAFKSPGHPLSKKVWQEISIIPHGKFLTYSNISEKIDSHRRSIGMACGKNPLPILIPCHRVIGKEGRLTGFSAGEGIETKKFLLQLEAPNVYFNIFN